VYFKKITTILMLASLPACSLSTFDRKSCETNKECRDEVGFGQVCVSDDVVIMSPASTAVSLTALARPRHRRLRHRSRLLGQSRLLQLAFAVGSHQFATTPKSQTVAPQSSVQLEFLVRQYFSTIHPSRVHIDYLVI